MYSKNNYNFEIMDINVNNSASLITVIAICLTFVVFLYDNNFIYSGFKTNPLYADRKTEAIAISALKSGKRCIQLYFL